MGRGNDQPTPPPAPTPAEFSPSTIKQDGKIVGKTYKDAATGEIITEYLSDPEALAREQANQASLTKLYSALGNRTTDQVDAANQYRDTFVNQASNTFNQQFDPTIRRTREDNASRFGSLNNSIFRDALAEIDKARSYGMSDIAQNAELNKQNYLSNYDNELYKQIAAISGDLGAYATLAGQTGQQSMAGSQYGTNLSLQNNAAATSYGMNLYNSLMSNYMNDRNNSSATKRAIYTAIIGGVSGGSSSSAA